MIILTHYIGEPSAPIDLPHNCPWIRVRDFDPVGIAMPVIYAAGAYGRPAIQQAAVQINAGKTVPITSINQVFRSLTSDMKNVTLIGNIQVEVGEIHDDLLEPLLMGRWRSEMFFQDAAYGIPPQTALVRQLLLPVPKGCDSIHLETYSPSQTFTRLRGVPTQLGFAGFPLSSNLRASSWIPNLVDTANALTGQSFSAAIVGIALSDFDISGAFNYLACTWTKGGQRIDAAAGSTNRYYRPLVDSPTMLLDWTYAGPGQANDTITTITMSGYF